MGQHKNKFSCNRVSTELLLIGYAGKIRLITETCILVTVYLILLIRRRFADRVSQTSADSTAMRSVNQKFLHAWHIFRIFVLHFEKNVTHFSWNKLQYKTEWLLAGLSPRPTQTRIMACSDVYMRMRMRMRNVRLVKSRPGHDVCRCHYVTARQNS